MADPLKRDPNRPDPKPPDPTPGGIAARALAGASAPYLNDLNPEQREAVVTLDGPVLVLAGAGTGKTRVLTTRIAHILATRRARPFEILAVTFTNKAAREMKERVGAMVGGVVEGMPWLGTFHSIGVKILRRHAEMVGLKPVKLSILLSGRSPLPSRRVVLDQRQPQLLAARGELDCLDEPLACRRALTLCGQRPGQARHRLGVLLVLAQTLFVILCQSGPVLVAQVDVFELAADLAE